mmetsp:Transcript_1434/g.3557  ORF Transcript_1434/g.3557 Transcript_1434/m.3557 type:complete len:96 (-) Transcript_1434:87-374(-)
MVEVPSLGVLVFVLSTAAFGTEFLDMMLCTLVRVGTGLRHFGRYSIYKDQDVLGGTFPRLGFWTLRPVCVVGLCFVVEETGASARERMRMRGQRR